MYLGLPDAAAALAASDASAATSPVSLPVPDLLSLGSPVPYLMTMHSKWWSCRYMHKTDLHVFSMCNVVCCQLFAAPLASAI